MDRTLIDLLSQLGLIDEASAGLLAELATTSPDNLLAVREAIRTAALAINTEEATDQDLETLAAASSAMAAIGAEFSKRNGQTSRRAERAKALASRLVAAADIPAPAGTRALPSMSALAARRPAVRRPVAARRSAQVITASGEPGGDLVDLLTSQLTYELRRGGPAAAWTGDPARSTLASVRVDYPEERQLGMDEVLNDARIEAVCAPSVLTASGGICAPVNVAYDVPGWSVADTPLLDSLPSFAATRGGIRFVLPHRLDQVTADNPVTVWTAANDIALNSPAAKPHATFTCQTPQEVLVDAIPAIVEFGNFQRQFQPEQVAGYMDKVAAVQARLIEATLLKTISDGSTAQTHDSGVLGVARDFLAALDLATAQIRHRNRTSTNATVRLAAPDWLREMVSADLARQLPGDSGGQSERLAIADNEIDHWLSVRSISPVWLYDSPTGFSGAAGNTPLQGWTGPAAPGQLPPFPLTTVVWLWLEGSWVLLDAGELSLGVVRDATLNARNALQVFSERMVKACFRGEESVQLSLRITPSGASAATQDTSVLLHYGS